MSEPQTIYEADEEEGPESRALEVTPRSLAPLSVQRAMDDLKMLRSFVAQELKAGMDYGTIPGTGDKSVLLLPGAQKVAMYYNCYPRYHVQPTELGDGHVEYVITASLFSRATGEEVATGIGSCTSMESKYRFRNAVATCPECGQELRKSKDGSGTYYCWKKAGGCGATFDGTVGDAQPRGKVENPNIHDQRNTVLKMGKKRALVDAAIGLGCLSELFTQDLEDFYDLPTTGPPATTGQARVSNGARTKENAAVAEPKRKSSLVDVTANKRAEAAEEQRESLLDQATEAIRLLSGVRETSGRKLITEWIQQSPEVKTRDFNLLNNKELESLRDWARAQMAPPEELVIE